MNVSENTTFHPEYIIESILFNRGMISLVAVGGFSLLFASQDYQYFEAYQFFYTLSIGLDYRDWETDRKSTRLNSSHRL